MHSGVRGTIGLQSIVHSGVRHRCAHGGLCQAVLVDSRDVAELVTVTPWAATRFLAALTDHLHRSHFVDPQCRFLIFLFHISSAI